MSLLEVKQLDKRFGLHHALSQISLSIEAGKVLGLVGENGAGKSTFIKIITGVYAPDGGSIYWNGQLETITSPRDAHRLGIHVLHQDRHLIPAFSGYENLYLGTDIPQVKFGLRIRWHEMKRRAEALKKELGMELDLDKTAEEMSPPERTLLELMRVMMQDCKLLILDEPTASLTDQETEILFRLIQQLTAQGTAILYVSHRMEEIFKLSDHIAVFRNGKNAGTLQREEANLNKVISMMTDTDYQAAATHERQDASMNPVLLSVNQLSTVDGRVKPSSLQVHAGEVVGIFGLAGAGRTELLEAIYGTRSIQEGEVVISGKSHRRMSPQKALEAGMVFIPEDRRSEGLVMGMTIRENMTLPRLQHFSSGLYVKQRKEKHAVRQWMENMNVKAVGSEQTVSELSGGNQQKVVFAKALMHEPILFLCDEATQAVDVMTREEIHRLLREQANQNRGVLYVTSDIHEILDVCDRIYVLREGSIVSEIAGGEATSEQLLQICYNR
ncbi:hypothetical protein BVG16_00785 [Paenibacillus selenitireducens]|uniref:ABC transporter domain-containing protein n=1 Tax=Paenibacillus selenitireducens TaxID=1324314 RepID=A0A1T2XM73_9BACL|nr:sugar ABC transporter ATP-binding protein [Paenibacillus selenitireducens]OPA80918.1 hypothetical protein BVG16_00785 [Paenibacillus selenitireducens]